jgi:cell division protein FtsN
MGKQKLVLGLLLAALIGTSGCSREQSDWEKARAANNTDSYELFLKKYPSGEFSAQAQARVKELYEERDWQKARDTDTPEAYQAFLKQYPEGKWTEEARIRVENFTLAQAPSGSPAANTPAPNAPASGVPGANAPAPNAPASSAPAAKPVPSSAAAPAPAAAPAGAHGSGAYGIQLGAFTSGKAAAHKRWAELQRKFPTILTGLAPRVIGAKTRTGHLYRLQVKGLAEADARAICGKLKAKSQPCALIVPHHG